MAPKPNSECPFYPGATTVYVNLSYALSGTLSAKNGTCVSVGNSTDADCEVHACTELAGDIGWVDASTGDGPAGIGGFDLKNAP